MKIYQDYYSDLFEELKLNISSEKNDFIIGQPTEDLVKFYLRSALSPIEFDPNQEAAMDHVKQIKTKRSHEREWGYQGEGDLKYESEEIVVKIPIIPNNKIDTIFKLRTQSISLSGGPQFSFNGNIVVIVVEIKGYGINLQNDQIGARVNKTRSEIEALLHAKNVEIRTENERLKTNLAQFIEERKKKLDGDEKRLNELTKLINIPLTRKGDDVVRKIQVPEKQFVSTIRPKTSTEEYKLDKATVVNIIRLLNNQALQFEKTPATYSKFSEPELRDLLLANLNSVFEGKATGESFNNKGKTDIYLNIDKGNILIFECKFYGGKKAYQETIDQILGYLTWRQNYGVMITFCTQKNFTKILDDAKGIISTHSSFEGGFEVLTKTHLISKHTLPGDEFKHVEIHHLYYNLYTE